MGICSYEKTDKATVAWLREALQWFVDRQGQLGHLDMNGQKYVPAHSGDKISFGQAIIELQSSVNNEDWAMQKIWSRRLAKDLVDWFRVTNPIAYAWRHNSAALYAILKGQTVAASAKDFLF